MALEQEQQKAELHEIQLLLQKINKSMIDLQYDVTQAFIRIHNLLDEGKKT